MKANPTNYRRQHIPNLKLLDSTIASSNKSKAKGLANTFFSLECPLNWDEHIFEEQNPPKAHEFKFPVFSPDCIANTLMKINLHKAPGLSGISNAILKKCVIILTPHLSSIYSAICRLKHMLAKL